MVYLISNMLFSKIQILAIVVSLQVQKLKTLIFIYCTEKKSRTLKNLKHDILFYTRKTINF